MPRITPLIASSSSNITQAVLIVSFLVVCSGCVVGDFVGAYFNTYYNAQKAFTEAEDELLAQRDPKAVDRQYLAPYVVPSTSKTKFTAVIEKCSKLLQYHPDSKFIDDALLMIGKSYYYQNDNQAAERKFRELLERYPDGDLALEARLLLANTLYRTNSKQASQVAALELLDLAEQSDEPGILANASMLLATIEFDNKNYIAAREHYSRAADRAEIREERFAAIIRVAEMHVMENEHAGAALAYAQAIDFSSTYVEESRARIGYARMQGKLGKYDESIDELEDLLSNTNVREFHGEIDFEIANVYRDMGDTSAAIDHYRYVDTAYARTEAAAKSHYELGLLYERSLLQYDSAKVTYQQGRTQLTSAPITVLLIERSEYMNKYFTLTGEIKRLDSLAYLILNPPDTAAFNDSLLARRDSLMSGDTLRSSMDSLPTLDTLLHYDKELAESPERSLAPDSSLAVSRSDSTAPVRWIPITIPLDTVNARLAQAKIELAALFYAGIGVRDSSEYWYWRLLNDHPQSPFVPRALYSLAQVLEQDSGSSRTVIDSRYRKIVLLYPESEFAPASRRILGIPEPEKEVDQADVAYSRAERLLTEGDTRRAISAFSSIVRTFPQSPLASKAQYAVAWIYEQEGERTDSAISNYQRLVELFPSSQYSALAKPKLDAVEAAKQAQAQPADSVLQNPPVPKERAPEPQPQELKEEPAEAPIEDQIPNDGKDEDSPPPDEVPPSDEVPPPPQMP
ncbi:MAG: tetratricopeptide repeat protein [Bacteroidota bacterium]